jgi:hypothetical protein
MLHNNETNVRGCCFRSAPLEKRFWASEFCARKLLGLERWGLATVLLILAAQVSSPHARRATINSFAWNFVLLSTAPVVSARIYFALFKPERFMRYRLRMWPAGLSP